MNARTPARPAMTRPLALEAFAAQSACVVVEIAATAGSTPREAGAFMLVSATAHWGTIGGGRLELLAMANARQVLVGQGVAMMDIPLGPDIAQCCGGRVKLSFRIADEPTLARLGERRRQEADAAPAVYVFGAGHVGRALARSLGLLPLRLCVIDNRILELAALPALTPTQLSVMPEAVVRAAPPGSAVVVATQDHALDFLIAAEALARDDLAYVGMIGSATKRARFAHWYVREAGGSLDRLQGLTLPLGGAQVRDKRPEVIAALTAAELLQAFARHEQRSTEPAGAGT